jgi:hypothetical protein
MTISTENQKDNQSIVKLAVKCMFINSEEEKKILTTLTELGEQDPAYSVIELFKEENTFSEAKIDFLLAFKKYLDTQALDIEFGQLAIANDFATSTAINDALDFQKNCYSKTEQTKELSEILLKKEQITLKHCTSILLVQNRIKDDHLASALDNLGSSEGEKKALNKRLGVIALKRELVSLDQLNEALTAQEKELLIGHTDRYLSEILKELFELSDDDLISILKEQKQVEKRRLDLEKVLSTYNSEIRLSNKLSELFKYRVPKTGLEAYVSKVKDLPEKIKPYDFFSWLKQIGLKYGIVDDKIIQDFLLNKKAEEEIVIAKGYPPIEGEDEAIEFFFDTDFVLPDKQLKKEEIPLVKKGDVLAKIIPVKKGKPGKDVWGNLIDPANLKTCFLDSWKGVKWDDLVFTADIDGIPLLRNGRSLMVSQYPEEQKTHIINENIESEIEETYKSLDLEVRGIIGKDAVVACHDLILKGDVFGNINATGDIEIRGKIGAVKKTENEDIPMPNIFAIGNIIAREDISNSKLETTKELIAPNAEIMSSKIVAVNGIIVKSICFNEVNPSVLQIGTKPDAKIYEIDKMIEQKTATLKELMYQEEFETMENAYHEQMETEKEHSEKNDVLMDILVKLEEFEVVKDFKQNQYPDTPENVGKNIYMLEIIKETNKIDAKDQKTHVEEMLVMESERYKAAVEATEKMSNDHKVRESQIKKKIEENKPEIEKTENDLEKLFAGKELIFSKQKASFHPINSMIKVKGQIAKGTVIKGQISQMIVEETMYGVTLMEVQDPLKGETEILVKGYFS